MRLTSLDVFRGMTMAAMILVNTASIADDDQKYAWLDHPIAWDGAWTVADLVFPFFLYIIGVAMAFSLARYTSKVAPVTKAVYLRILRRSLILFGLGLLLNGLVWNYSFFTPKIFDLGHLRIMGVLQRIGIAFFLASIAILTIPKKGQWVLAGSILIGYWLMISFIPAPDRTEGVFSQLGNFSAYVDRLIIPKNHLHKSFQLMGDPEGLFSTLPAMVNVLFGYFTGEWLKRQSATTRTSITLVMWGLAAVVIGLIWGHWFPIHKKLWTSSFVVMSTGWGLILLAGCYELVDVRKYRQWLKPFEIMGLNAIAIFVASIVEIKLLLMNTMGSGEKALSIYAWLTQYLFGWAGNINSGLLFAIATVLFWMGIAYLMYRQNWFLKI